VKECEVGQEYTWNLTTNTVKGKVVRELGDSERDPEVGRMFEITISVFEDEIVREEL